jgi:alpha-beta hydrolase superfamily lysophospholipase
MEIETLDVRTREGYALKVGVCAKQGAGSSVLVVPGLFSHMGWYRPLGEALAARGSAAFLLDRRGTGRSEGVPGHMDSWRHLVDDVLRVVARMKELHPAASVCALGVSLGAAVTLAASLAQPGCFERQAVLSPGLAPGLALPLWRRIGLAYDGFARPRVLYELPYRIEHLSDREEVRETLWSDPLRTRAFTSRFLIEVFRMQRFVRRNAPHLGVPLLALLAEKDAMVDNQVVLETLQHVERTPVRIEIFEGAHHVLPASVPLEDLVGRIDHWFRAPANALEPRVAVQRVPRAEFAAAGAGAEGGG